MALGMGLVQENPTFPEARLFKPAMIRRIWSFLESLGKKRTEGFSSSSFLAFLHSQRAHFWPTDFRHFFYYSRHNQPMQAWFLRICPLGDRKKESLLSLIEQLWQLAIRAPLQFVDKTGRLQVIR
jgi:hypothetical protein